MSAITHEEMWEARRHSMPAVMPPPSPSNARTVNVYVMADCCDQCVKVGISDNPDHRLATMQRSSPRMLRFVYVSPGFPRHEARRIEKLAHEVLSDDQAWGEWFHCKPWLAVACVRDCVEGGPA